ncbi:MAG: PAS domain-containing protein [Deltaproteobacteria bacterium]|nr:PAS domain-containing protein [Deltaproteobacteria bacterium]
MLPQLTESLFTFASCAAVAVYVVSRGERGLVHWLVIGLMGSMMLWTGGLAVNQVLATLGIFSGNAFLVCFLGVFAIPPCWVMLAATYGRLRLFAEHPGLIVAMLVPSTLSDLVVVTNSAHRLFVRDFSLVSAAGGDDFSFAGPLFWVTVGWAVLLWSLGTAIYLGLAFRLAVGGEPSRGLGLGFAILLPILAILAIGLGLSPVKRDMTPMALGLSVVLLFFMSWRHRLSETLPLARRDVIEHLSEGVILTDASGLVVDINPRAAEILDRSAARVRHRPVAQVIADLDVEAESLLHQRSIDGLLAGGPTLTLEIETDDDRLVELSAACVRASDGEPAGLYAMLRDRTEQRRYEHFLLQSQRLETVAGLSAGIAHEVNNPLAFVRANLNHVQGAIGLLTDRIKELGGDEQAEGDELRLVVEESVEGIDRISRIIERMRRYSRIQDEELESVSLNEVVEDAMRMAQLHPGGPLALELDLQEDLPALRASKEHLIQALLNVFVNARQALSGQHDSELRVLTRRVEDGTEIRVRDNGPGIPPEIRSRVLDPFFTTKPPGEGTGLGLSISFGILREHGGTLELDSQPGTGTEVVMHFPADSDS